MASSIGKILHKKKVVTVFHTCDFSGCDQATLLDESGLLKLFSGILVDFKFEVTRCEVILKEGDCTVGLITFSKSCSLHFRSEYQSSYLSMDLTLDQDDISFKKLFHAFKEGLSASSVETKKTLRGPSVLGF